MWPVRDAYAGGVGPAPVPKTGQLTSYGNRDDGELQMGVVWPDPRFTDNFDGTVTDDLTGLIWLRDSFVLQACPSRTPWRPATHWPMTGLT